MTVDAMEAREQDAQPGRANPQVLASFVEHLVKNQVISSTQAIQINRWKQQNPADRRTTLELLEQEIRVPRDVLRLQIAQYYAFRVIDPRDRALRRLIPAEINKMLRSLPESVSQQLLKAQLLPYDLAENQPDKLVLVTPNPSDREIHKLARLLPYKKFEICYLKESDWNEFRQVLASAGDKPAPEVSVAPVAEGLEPDFEGNIDREILRTQLLAQLDHVFADAVRTGATEIHFVPLGARKTQVLFRLDGHLSIWASMDDARCETVTTAIKTAGLNLDRYERMTGQQGMIHKIVEKKPLRMTVSTVPILSRDPGMRYESTVLHIMRENESVPSLESLGLDLHTSNVLTTALTTMRGLVLFAGYDQKALHATVAACLKTIVKNTVNIVTLEDPVEFLVDGVRQIKLNPRLSFNDGVQLLSAHDPDVVVLGDIDDPEIARVSLRLANIRQLVFCSVHARDGVAALSRLFHTVGNGPLIGDALCAVIAQQTVRTLCPRCKQLVHPVALPQAIGHLRLSKGEAPPSAVYRAVGCIDCHGGYKGSEYLFEAIAATPDLREILDTADQHLSASAVSKVAIADGMIPFRKKALALLERGNTSIDQLLAFAV
jgi:type IV pilus assembly protein PilB